MKLGKKKTQETTKQDFEKLKEQFSKGLNVPKTMYSSNATTSDGSALSGKNGYVYLNGTVTGTYNSSSGTWTVPTSWEFHPAPDVHEDCQPKADYEELLFALLHLLLSENSGEIIISQDQLNKMGEWRLVKADMGATAVRFIAVPAEVAIDQ